jgi:hypothetical protein
MIGHPVYTRITMYLYKASPTAPEYRGIYLLDDQKGYDRFVAVIPAGQPVLFARANALRGFNKDDNSLYGTLKFQGKVYPINFECGYGDDDDTKKTLDYTFENLKCRTCAGKHSLNNKV